jgi:hypothetical protein
VRRRVWPGIVLGLLLLLVAGALFFALAPATGEQAVAYGDRDRWSILVALEAGWLIFVLSVRGWLARSGAGIVSRVGRLLGALVLAGGIAVGAAAGWLVSSFLSAKVHGTTSSAGGGGGAWDD